MRPNRRVSKINHTAVQFDTFDEKTKNDVIGRSDSTSPNITVGSSAMPAIEHDWEIGRDVILQK